MDYHENNMMFNVNITINICNTHIKFEFKNTKHNKIIMYIERCEIDWRW